MKRLSSGKGVVKDRRRLAGVLAILLAVTACVQTNHQTQTTPSIHPSVHPNQREWVESIMRLRSMSDFDLHVLKDLWVSDEELVETRGRYHSCMEKHGLEGELGTEQYEFGATTADHEYLKLQNPDLDVNYIFDVLLDEIVMGCFDEIASVADVYFELRSNPEGLSGADIFRRCFEEHGFDEGAKWTDDELMERLYISGDLYEKYPEAIGCFENLRYGDS